MPYQHNLSIAFFFQSNLKNQREELFSSHSSVNEDSDTVSSADGADEDSKDSKSENSIPLDGISNGALIRYVGALEGEMLGIIKVVFVGTLLIVGDWLGFWVLNFMRALLRSLVGESVSIWAEEGDMEGSSKSILVGLEVDIPSHVLSLCVKPMIIDVQSLSMKNPNSFHFPQALESFLQI